MRRPKKSYIYSLPASAKTDSAWGCLRQKNRQYKNTATTYKQIVIKKGGANPYSTCKYPLTVGLKAHPKFHAILTKLATVARASASTCSITNV